jgi:ABC-type oligopeptide transport system ATPase subunit
MSMLQIERVSKIYKSGTFGGGLKLALQQVSFDIDRGEVVSLIGESGSGKSTLGKIVLRLAPLSAGRVVFEGSDVVGLQKKQLHEYYRYVQGVFQDPFSSYNPLYKADRVFEMLRQEYFSGLSRRDWDAKVASALEAVTLNPADVLNKFPHQLSGGQQQRLLVARALLLEVKLLIADEIISMLDASTRVDVLNMLVSLKSRGLGILFITHDLSLGNYISDKTVILRRGVVVEMGLTQKVFGNPQHSYTRNLLTAVPQLHKKWDPSDLATLVSAGSANGTTNGSAIHATAGTPEILEAERTEVLDAQLGEGELASAETDRFSKGWGRAAFGGKETSDEPQQGPRPSLMDMPDSPWGRRGPRPNKARAEALLLSQAPPELVECEEGHFVAVGDSH